MIITGIAQTVSILTLKLARLGEIDGVVCCIYCYGSLLMSELLSKEQEVKASVATESDSSNEAK